ncbi:peptidase S8 [Lacihabitans sp. LS3-19]|uniref:S8 family peptidase n=1 Tax=Lacihabitans sp. LS3-19 TaxID=2487335 RepID=UPI0020CECD6A|nr:S8 family peptidase [Lacihabitans sp. LS3-19]MCP9769027.1 peptidase S8 [Lacihabitans sp. LS3-19]
MKKIVFFLFIIINANAQDLKTKFNWHNLDLQDDGVRGMSTEKAYKELLKNRPSKTVIVGVIDSGIDIKHEDLKDIIWINSKEIPGNGVDDDKNGFIDDVDGWDFIGGASGQDINQEQLESVRILKSLEEKFGENPSKRLKKKNKVDFALMSTLKSEINEKRQEATQYLPMYKGMYDRISKAEDLLKKTIGKETITKEDVIELKEENFDRSVRAAKQAWLNLIAMGATLTDIKEGVTHFEEEIEYNLNEKFDPRKIVGDDLKTLGYGSYGNNEVTGPDAMHGTHVAGIIGASRNNNLGVMGVADNVQIMTIRCVPNGDERDKDVANAIKYAVDNGAEVINMSFGKPYSPEKKWVDEAVKYAESKGVLLVSAAGNESEDIDQHVHYPTRILNNGKTISSWITVGASSFTEGEELPADFSNYGKNGVDVFAPGVAIYSSVPGSRYEEKQGTSMASPAVAGVAALLKSYFPTLTANQIKNIILETSVKLNGVSVNLPGEKTKVDFSELCNTAGIVNTYNAVKMAIQMVEKQ